jgi:methyl-accepting chemotaxis protein
MAASSPERLADLSRRLEVSGSDEIGDLAAAFNGFMDRLEGMLGHVRRAADRMGAAAQDLAAATEQMSSGALQQAASLEQTAASIEEMTATVRQNADNAQNASQLAATSRDTAERGKRVVIDAVAITVATEPSIEESFYWRAMAKQALGDQEGAVADLRESLKWHPDFGPTMALLQQWGVQP